MQIKQKISDITSRFNNLLASASKGSIKNPKLQKFFKDFLEKSDLFIDFILREETKKSTPRNEVIQLARAPILFGSWVIFITFGVFGLWASIAPIDSAAIAPGLVVVDSNKKTIQHLEGGIIETIYVKDGDEVKKGQPLVKLNDTKILASHQILLSQFKLLKANENRLIAERDESKEIQFDVQVSSEAGKADVAKIIDSQNRLFKARKDALDGKINIYGKKIEEANREIQALESQEKAANDQITLIKEEIYVVEKLLKTGNALKPRLLSLQRNLAGLEGAKGEYAAKIAKARQEISQFEIEIMNIKNSMQNEVIKELRDVQAQIVELEDKIKASADMLDRAMIISPQDGIINNLAFHTIGGVIQPGVKILEIIPIADKLVIDARVSPQNISVVNVTMPAKVKLSAYKTRNLPMIMGKVVQVSADLITDDRTGEKYYNGRIEVDKDQFENNPKLKNIELYPGMPAEVYIITGSRTLVRYLLDPVFDSMRRSFRQQ